MIEKIGKYFKYHMPLPLRGIINSIYYDPRMCQFQGKQVDYVVMDGCKFLPSDELTSLVRPRGPWFEGVRPTDTVLDIGAGIGSVAIPLARKAEKVYALEPLFDYPLKLNVALNDMSRKIDVLPWALSEIDPIKVSYSSRTETVHGTTLSNLRKTLLSIDFLKVDCEGAEWSIRMCEVEGIRELRIEWHLRRGKVKQDSNKLNAWVKFLEDKGYLVKLYRNMHKSDIQFKEIVYMVASLGRTEPFLEQLFP